MKKTFRYIILLLVVLTTFYTAANQILRSLYPLDHEGIILKSALSYNLEPFLIPAVINAESHFKEEAVSSKGASGLMQLTKDTYDFTRGKVKNEELKDDILDPETNITLGAFYLSYLLADFGTLPEALAAYNAGPTKVRTWLCDKEFSDDGKTLKKIPYAETEQYIEKVMRNLEVYKFLYGEL